jgi:hypothetical protein
MLRSARSPPDLRSSLLPRLAFREATPRDAAQPEGQVVLSLLADGQKVPDDIQSETHILGVIRLLIEATAPAP